MKSKKTRKGNPQCAPGTVRTCIPLYMCVTHFLISLYFTAPSSARRSSCGMAHIRSQRPERPPAPHSVARFVSLSGRGTTGKPGPSTKGCHTGSAARPAAATTPSLQISPQFQRKVRAPRPGHAPLATMTSHARPCTLTARRKASRSADVKEGIGVRETS